MYVHKCLWIETVYDFVSAIFSMCSENKNVQCRIIADVLVYNAEGYKNKIQLHRENYMTQVFP